jgi:two-component system, sensor histidine kinase
VDIALKFAPELVLCDLSLPGLDGFGVARALRANPSTSCSRLVALTGYSSEEIAGSVRRAGFDGHMAKPVSLEQLNKILAAAG